MSDDIRKWADKNGSPQWSTDIMTQSAMENARNIVALDTRGGTDIHWDEKRFFGGYEYIIGRPTYPGGLPVVYHYQKT